MALEYQPQRIVALNVLQAFADEGLVESDFSGSTGYGYDDAARVCYESLLARVLGVERTIARLSIAKQVVMPASQSGKVKTMAQALALGGLVGPFHYLDGFWDVPGEVLWWLAIALMAVAVVLTMTSGVEFARDVLRHRRDAAAAPTP